MRVEPGTKSVEPVIQSVEEVDVLVRYDNNPVYHEKPSRTRTLGASTKPLGEINKPSRGIRWLLFCIIPTAFVLAALAMFKVHTSVSRSRSMSPSYIPPGMWFISILAVIQRLHELFCPTNMLPASLTEARTERICDLYRRLSALNSAVEPPTLLEFLGLDETMEEFQAGSNSFFPTSEGAYDTARAKIEEAGLHRSWIATQRNGPESAEFYLVLETIGLLIDPMMRAHYIKTVMPQISGQGLLPTSRRAQLEALCKAWR